MSLSAFAQQDSVKDGIKSFHCKIDVHSDFPSYTELKFELDDEGAVKPVQFIFMDGFLTGEKVTVDIADVILDERNILSISTTLSEESKVTMNTIVNLNTKEGQLILKSKPDLKPSDRKYRNILIKYPLVNCSATFVK